LCNFDVEFECEKGDGHGLEFQVSCFGRAASISALLHHWKLDT